MHQTSVLTGDIRLARLNDGGCDYPQYHGTFSVDMSTIDSPDITAARGVDSDTITSTDDPAYQTPAHPTHTSPTVHNYPQ